MTIDSRVRTLVALAVVAIMLSAIGLYAYFSMRGEESSEDVLQLESLDFESGSYYPWLWVNSTDDSLIIDHSCRLDINFFNESTGERALTIGTGGTFRFANGTWSLMQQLDLQNLSPGNYSIDLYANCTFFAFEAPTPPPKYGRLQGNISLPPERPLLPRVLGVKLDYDDEHGAWRYHVELEDPDQDGDTAYVYVSNKSGFTVFHTPWVNNTNRNLTWVLEGFVETTVPFDFLGVEVKDKDGPHSDAWFRW
jgi:hypothetical protein